MLCQNNDFLLSRLLPPYRKYSQIWTMFWKKSSELNRISEIGQWLDNVIIPLNTFEYIYFICGNTAHKLNKIIKGWMVDDIIILQPVNKLCSCEHKQLHFGADEKWIS